MPATTHHLEPNSHPMRAVEVLRDGALAGLLGAVTAAVVSALFDAAAGTPLRTPVVLHGLFLHGAAGGAPVDSLRAVLEYSAIHVGLWLLAGALSSLLVASADAHPRMGAAAFAAVGAAFLSVLYIAGAFHAPDLPRSSLWLGTLVGAGVCVGFLLLRHPTAIRLVGLDALSEGSMQDLERALETECATRAFYRAAGLCLAHDPLFERAVAEKDHQVEMLLELFTRYDLTPPADVWEEQSEAPPDRERALREALRREREAIEMYDRLVTTADDAQIRGLFLRIQAETLSRLVPDLEQAVNGELEA